MAAATPIQLDQFSNYLKPRPRDMHKGSAGHVLIVGGDDGFTGAARMAAEAALRVGAGLATIATHSDDATLFNLAHPEIMCHRVKAAKELQPLIEKASVIIIGPGLGKSKLALEFLKMVLETNLPLVVDADGLNLLAEHPQTHQQWVLTPHPGEAGRLLQLSTAEIQQDRPGALQKLQNKYHGVVVLKGAGSLVLDSGLKPAICEAGNPGMASAGMGDVLSGVIGGFLAQKIPAFDAAKLGVFIHATAGDMAAKAGGERGMIATDLMPYLRQLVNPEQ
jgi:hydroxyethylthiazole kinase-like uncharacterized protein yjeF